MATGSQNLTSYQANKLTNERELYVDLSTTRDSNNKILFDGTADRILQISGILSTIHGGTGTDSDPTPWGIIYATSETENEVTTYAYASTGAGTAGYLLQSNATSAPDWIQATDSNVVSTIVKRDSNGDFSAGIITADLSGNAATATALTSNAGGTEQPIYFSDGKPAATSYALKATVNNGDANYVAYYSDARAISSSKAATAMIMPAHYYHNLYNNNPTTGTTVYVHYYNGDTTSTNTFANLRVKSGTSYKVLAFGGDGQLTWGGTMTANGGYLKSTANSNTVTIGSQNTSYCHIENSANIPFYFNKVIQSDGGFTIYNTGNNHWRNGYIQINKSDGTDCYIELCRATNADWRILNSGGNLYFQNNWTSAKGSYFNVLQLDFNTGDITISKGNIFITDSGTATKQLRFQVGTNDYGRIGAGATASNAGWIEIATADDGNEPIYARQYTGTFTTIKRTLTLLDANGNTTVPGGFGVANTSNSTGLGISLYNGAANGQPDYGMMFAGTATFGKFGDVSNDWATYFTMNRNDTRGWIFKSGTGSGNNYASISGRGHFTGTLSPSSWIDGQRYMNAAYNIADYSNTGSYNPWMRATNTWSSGADTAKVGRWFSFGTLGTSFYWIGSTTTRTANSYDYGMTYNISNGTLTATTFSGTLSGNASTATALTSNAGGGEQPIYFTGGKPSATSYALKATVNNSTAGYFAYYSAARAISGTSNARLTDGCLNLYPSSGSYREGIRIYSYSSWATIMLLGNDNTATSGTSTNSWGLFNNNGTFYINRATSSGAGASRAYANSNGWYFDKAYGAVWNDFAEFRRSNINEPGRVIIPFNDGIARISTERLQSGGRIISDTFGFSVGASDTAKTPIGVSGRVLAYPYQNKENYHIGDAVCTAPNGTVDIMTREEIIRYPERIIGIVNEIPSYEFWESSLECPGGEPTTTQIKVNGRIWIDIK